MPSQVHQLKETEEEATVTWNEAEPTKSAKGQADPHETVVLATHETKNCNNQTIATILQHEQTPSCDKQQNTPTEVNSKIPCYLEGPTTQLAVNAS